MSLGKVGAYVDRERKVADEIGQCGRSALSPFKVYSNDSRRLSRASHGVI